MRRLVLTALLALAVSQLQVPSPSCAEEKWRGVDEAVVERFAEEGGRPATGCLLDIKGDALLFAFLAAGIAGGFVIGYYYREFSQGGGDGRGAAAGEGKGQDAL